MTPEQIKEIEDTANAVTPNPGHLITVLAHKDIPALIAEIRRLQALLDDQDKASKEAMARIKELECAIGDVYNGLNDAGEDPYVAGEDTARDVLGKVMPKDIFYVDASNTLVVPGWEAPSQSLEIKSYKRWPSWDYDDELRAHICHYSHRSDYRLVVSLIQTDRYCAYNAETEWLVGGSDWIGEFHDLDQAKEAAIAWAEKYEGQR